MEDRGRTAPGEDAVVARAVLKSPGSKWRIAGRIVSTFPEHDTYLEPFFGSGAVLFAKARSRVEVVNDRDGEVANLFGTMRDPDARRRLMEAVEFTAWSEQEMRAACSPADGLDGVERARRLLVRSWMNVGARQIGAAHFRHAGVNSDENPASAWTRLPSRIREAGERLQGVQVLNKDAVELIRKYQSDDVLIYADPPYPARSRSGAGRFYRHEMGDGQHEGLLAALRLHPGPVALSGYACGLYDEALRDWRRFELPGWGQANVSKTEVLWLNPEAAHGAPNTLF